MLVKSFVTGALCAQSAFGAAISLAAAKTYKNMAYYGNWDVYENGYNYPPQNLNVGSLSHVIYAFADIDQQDGRVISSDPWADYQMKFDGDKTEDGTNAYGNIKQLFIHKKNNRKLKTLLSIGGFTRSQAGHFDAATNSTAAIQRFADSAVKMLADWGFDGIDIDYEFPKWNADGEKFYQLVKATRQALDDYATAQGQNYHYLLTIATSAGPDVYAKIPLAKLNQRVDMFQLMTYDFAGDWDSTTGHASNIYADKSNPTATKFSADKAVSDYIAKGVDASKILLGLPLFGRSFANTHGLGKTYSGTGKGSGFEKGVWLFKDLPRPNAKVMTKNDLMATYTYDSKTTEFVTLDGSASAKLKATYLKNKNLGGAFFWEAAGDKTGSSSLIKVMANAMGTLDTTQNQLDYPVSQFDNIKNGLPNN